jgi:hypothetical protein
LRESLRCAAVETTHAEYHNRPAKLCMAAKVGGNPHDGGSGGGLGGCKHQPLGFSLMGQCKAGTSTQMLCSHDAAEITVASAAAYTHRRRRWRLRWRAWRLQAPPIQCQSDGSVQGRHEHGNCCEGMMLERREQHPLQHTPTDGGDGGSGGGLGGCRAPPIAECQCKPGSGMTTARQLRMHSSEKAAGCSSPPTAGGDGGGAGGQSSPTHGAG